MQVANYEDEDESGIIEVTWKDNAGDQKQEENLKKDPVVQKLRRSSRNRTAPKRLEMQLEHGGKRYMEKTVPLMEDADGVYDGEE